LFTGTRGVGKTTVSRILAKSLNCQGPDGQGGITPAPCGVCQACRDIDAGRFVDYTELDAASNRGVDEVQALLEQAVYKPVQGRFKVFMIDEVHMLTGHAFNAMLKTLEEPPEYLKFVLATTDPQKVPVTVLSRCLQFNLRPMAAETVLDHLTRVLQAEEVPAEAHALRLIARAARGSMRDALSLTDQAIAFGDGRLVEAGVRQMLGSVDRGHVLRLIEALALGDGKTVVETAEGLRREGLSAASTLEEMTAVLQGMAVLQAVPARIEATVASDPDEAETVRLAALMPPDETQLLYSLCLHGRAELGLAPDEYAALTMVLLRLLAFKPSGAASEEKKTLNEASAPALTPVPAAARAVLQPPSAPVRASSPAHSPEPLAERAEGQARPASRAQAPAEPGPASRPAAPPGQRLPVIESLPPRSSPAPGDADSAPATPRVRIEQADMQVMAVQVRVQPPAGAREAAYDAARASESEATAMVSSEEGDFWHALVTDLVAAEAIAALARELALQSQLVARDVDQWLLRIERESLNQPSSRDKLQAALAALGHGVRIAIEIGMVSDSPAMRNRRLAEARQRAAEEAIHSDPEIQTMMREWDARIVPGTLRPA
ncbi:MAG: DNA polymerase III subunit gamma/tau, partial [Gammaproteobacteria bacterium]|nr:DNA polymerase III subunit gamma/tau [Gammaproteobacteria bacterium]